MKHNIVQEFEKLLSIVKLQLWSRNSANLRKTIITLCEMHLHAVYLFLANKLSIPTKSHIHPNYNIHPH